MLCDLLAFFQLLKLGSSILSMGREEESFHGWPSSLSTWCNLRDLYRFIVGTTGMCEGERRANAAEADAMWDPGQPRISEQRRERREARKCQNIGYDISNIHRKRYELFRHSAKKEHLIQKCLWKAQVCRFFKIHFIFQIKMISQIEFVQDFPHFPEVQDLKKVNKGHEIY